MKIIIEDLPNDRNVKKLTFDIEFEEGEPIKLEKIDVPKIKEVDVSKTNTVYSGDMPVFKNNLTDKTTPEGPNNRTIDDRPKKEIPSEMTDMEF